MVKALFMGGHRHTYILDVSDPPPEELIFPLEHREYCSCNPIARDGVCAAGPVKELYKIEPRLAHDPKGVDVVYGCQTFTRDINCDRCGGTCGIPCQHCRKAVCHRCREKVYAKIRCEKCAVR